jgi:hypothetical protein
MPNVYGWRSQAAVGQMGVERVVKYLKSKGYHVEDVSEDKDYQSQDIDLRVRGQKKQRWRTVEVKTDTYDTGNIFLELVSSSGKPGCVFKSRAQVWLYYLPKRNILLFMELPVLQLWLIEHCAEFKRVTVGSGSARGKGFYTIQGIKVPIVQLVRDGVASAVKLEEEEECQSEKVA